MLLLLLPSSSPPLSHAPTSFHTHTLIFFLTGGDPHSGDGDLGVRDLKGDFLSWILPPLSHAPPSASFFLSPPLSCSSFCFLLPLSLSLPLYFLPLDIL